MKKDNTGGEVAGGALASKKKNLAVNVNLDFGPKRPLDYNPVPMLDYHYPVLNFNPRQGSRFCTSLVLALSQLHHVLCRRVAPTSVSHKGGLSSQIVVAFVAQIS
ncbi:hypothetical protein EVAR_5553_1 [Eumeta japonica]|uniref:Uncharacterized protein n=1 Tax=Eumeta variegata TaxID=151549 RepID=A0A4C1U187_EUMVA|nr:hypothetical protein EVAR_5553_1 [Eumeta japonica]